jgi:peroxiredoxin Q/BCP
MKLRALLSLAAGVALSFGAAVTGLGQQPAPELKVGDTAPPFNLQGSDGKPYRLADFKGKSAVVLAWFPKAFTGG